MKFTTSDKIGLTASVIMGTFGLTLMAYGLYLQHKQNKQRAELRVLKYEFEGRKDLYEMYKNGALIDVDVV